MRTRSAVDTLPTPRLRSLRRRVRKRPELTDRRGEHFPVLRAWGCRSEIENGKILYLADKSKDWQSLGLRFAQLRFTTESASECVRVLRAYQGETVEAPENITRGLFYRGAE